MNCYQKNNIERQNYSSDIYSFIIVANISAALHDTQAQARKLSITAKNARVLAFHAGEEASGFKVLTNYIDEFSGQIICFAKRIQSLSANISDSAWKIAHGIDFNNRIAHTLTLQNCAENVSFVDELYQQQLQALDEYKQHFAMETKELESLLHDIVAQMRAASFIAIVAKVEAVESTEYVDSLNNVALAIADIAKSINASINHCFKCLHAYNEGITCAQ